MDVKSLSNRQLFELINNRSLSSDIRRVANEELSKRNLSIAELDELVLSRTVDLKILSLTDKLLLITFPFFGFIHVYRANLELPKEEQISYWVWTFFTPYPIDTISTRFKLKGQMKIAKQYYHYFLIGVVFYTVLIVVFASLFLFR